MTDRPNVVVIVADTFRRDHLGAYGNPFIRTPYLDEFARSSVVFDHHVVSSFPTMPARADILTGTFSYTHMGWEPLPRHLLTLPEILSKAGYLTMGVVDTPFFLRNGFGYDRGFDDFVWIRGQGDDTRPHERADARSTWRSEQDRMVARTMTSGSSSTWTPWTRTSPGTHRTTTPPGTGKATPESRSTPAMGIGRRPA